MQLIPAPVLTESLKTFETELRKLQESVWLKTPRIIYPHCFFHPPRLQLFSIDAVLLGPWCHVSFWKHKLFLTKIFNKIMTQVGKDLLDQFGCIPNWLNWSNTSTCVRVKWVKEVEKCILWVILVHKTLWLGLYNLDNISAITLICTITVGWADAYQQKN